MQTLNELAAEVFKDNHQWWYDIHTDVKLDRNKDELLMLVVSEIAEAMEGLRKDLYDDHLPKRKMVEVELADTVIRVLDYAGAFRYHLQRSVTLPHYFTTMDNKAAFLFAIVNLVVEVRNTRQDKTDEIAYNLSRVIAACEKYCDLNGLDLWGALDEKLEYNKHRADHKKEARLASNGKKF